MAIISQDTDTRYWKIIDVDPVDDGTFNIEAKQVKDKDGTPTDVRPAQRQTINRQNNIPIGTIVKITDVRTLDRTFQINPTT